MNIFKKISRRLMPKERKLGYGSSAAVMIDLGLIENIRRRDRSFLSDAVRVEKELLPELGLNDEKTIFFPPELSPLFGRGLRIWQYPNQFSKYLVQLSRFKIDSYMEIGVRHGGTFVTTVEYLSRFNPIREAVAVDINDCPSVVAYSKLNPAAAFLKVDTTSPAFKGFMSAHSTFDLVLIDGNHDEAACRSDLMNVRDKTRMLVFHDIEPNAAPGVAKVWSELKDSGAAGYDFYEFRDQYSSVRGRWLGIGLAVRKDMPMN